MAALPPKMSTTRKLAIFFTSIPRDRAITIMKHFTIPTMEALVAEIRALGTIPPETQGTVFQEIADKLAIGVSPSGGEEVARQIIAGVVGEEEARKMLERAKPKKPKPFSMIVNVAGQDLATILSNEQSSTVAIVLSFLPAKKVADVLSFLPSEFREEIVIKLAQSRDTEQDIIDRIEAIFYSKVRSSLNKVDQEQDKSNLGGPDFVAEIFQSVDKETEDQLMGALQEESPEVAERIRDLMFTFEDVIKLGDSEVQKLLREIPTDKLVIALRGSSQALYDKFTGNLSKRARETLKEEMEMSAKVKKSEIENERKAIVSIIRALESAGEIKISAAGEEDVYV